MTQQYQQNNINQTGGLTTFTASVGTPNLALSGAGNQIALVDAAVASVVTLPGSEESGAGAVVTVVNTTGTAPITFAAAAGDAVEAPAAILPLTLANLNEAYMFVSDGAGNWVAAGANF